MDGTNQALAASVLCIGVEGDWNGKAFEYIVAYNAGDVCKCKRRLSNKTLVI